MSDDMVSVNTADLRKVLERFGPGKGPVMSTTETEAWDRLRAALPWEPDEEAVAAYVKIAHWSDIASNRRHAANDLRKLHDVGWELRRVDQ